MMYFFVESIGILTVLAAWAALVYGGRKALHSLRREHSFSALYMRGYVLLVLVVVTILAASIVGSILDIWSR